MCRMNIFTVYEIISLTVMMIFVVAFMASQYPEYHSYEYQCPIQERELLAYAAGLQLQIRFPGGGPLTTIDVPSDCNGKALYRTVEELRDVSMMELYVGGKFIPETVDEISDIGISAEAVIDVVPNKVTSWIFTLDEQILVPTEKKSGVKQILMPVDITVTSPKELLEKIVREIGVSEKNIALFVQDEQVHLEKGGRIPEELGSKPIYIHLCWRWTVIVSTNYAYTDGYYDEQNADDIVLHISDVQYEAVPEQLKSLDKNLQDYKRRIGEEANMEFGFLKAASTVRQDLNEFFDGIDGYAVLTQAACKEMGEAVGTPLSSGGITKAWEIVFEIGKVKS